MIARINNQYSDLIKGLLLTVLCWLFLFQEQRIIVNFSDATGLSVEFIVWSIRILLMLLFVALFVVKGFSYELFFLQAVLSVYLISGLINSDIDSLPIKIARQIWLVAYFSLIYIAARNIKSPAILLLSISMPMVLFGLISSFISCGMSKGSCENIY